MVIAYCKQQKLIDFLLENECKIVSNKYWDEYNIVIFEKDNETFPIIMEEVFYHFKVRKICNMLGIPAPEPQDSLYDVSTPIADKEGEEE